MNAATTLPQGGRASASRRMTGVERLWLVSERICPPFVNQMVLEGSGGLTPPDRLTWPGLMQRVSRAQPATRARLQGVLGASRWMADGPEPTVQVLDGSRWDGQSPEGAPFLREGIDPRQGPTCQIWILPGATTRIVVRTHHALMDGQGTLLLARALFAALRGEELPTAELGPTTDEDIACELGRSGEAPQPRRFGAPTGLAESAPFEITWGRVRIPGKVSRLLPRIAVSLAQYSQEDAALPLRFAVPVDMRRHRPGLQSSANLTGLARLDMAPLLATKDPVEAVAQALEAAMARGAEAAVVRSSRIARWLPLSWMGWIGTQNARRCLGDGRYPSSGVLSNLGRLRLEAFSGGGFTAQRAFFIPPGNPGLPLFLSMAGDSEGIELCAAVPCGLATQDRLSSLLEHLRTVCLSS